MKITLDTAATPKGDAAIITLTNDKGASVVLSSIGAGIVEINVPDRNGKMDDVVLGYRNISDYLYDGPTMGKTPGRYANRICHGRFTLDGKEYELPVNCGPHHLHGGPEGFQNRLWNYDIGTDSVAFTLHSPDGDSGYPGNVTAKVTYTWSDDNVLTIEYDAEADAPTTVNMTNHAYWNLDGEGSGCALRHVLQINASSYVETDDTLEPTGTLRRVAGSPMDFTEPKEVGRDIREHYDALLHGKGYDHCYAFDAYDGHSTPVKGAELYSPVSGRRLTVRTTYPGMQLYTANWLTGGTPEGRHGADYKDYDAVALECQMFPDAPNHPGFPSAILRPGERYHHVIVYELDVI